MFFFEIIAVLLKNSSFSVVKSLRVSLDKIRSKPKFSNKGE